MSSDAIQTVNEADDKVAAGAMRAAYVLGRNPHLIDGWLESVGAIAGFGEERPWNWEYPYTLFGASFDAWPGESFAELDQALRTLVLAHIVDGAVLLELHRVLDDVQQDCMIVAQFAAANSREEASEMHWQGLKNNLWAIKFGEDLLANAPERLRAHRQLGNYIGKLIARLVRHWDYEPLLSELRRTASLAAELFSPAAPTIDRLRNLILAEPASPLGGQPDPCKQLLSSLEELDGWILQQTPPHLAPVNPYIVLDDRQRSLTFLEIEIPFAVFADANALGGLAILRVLIRHPSTPIRAIELIELSDLNCKVQMLSEYLSRFRGVLKDREQFWPTHITCSRTYTSAKMGFIVSDRLARMAAAGNDTWYRLDLPRYRLRYIPVDPA